MEKIKKSSEFSSIYNNSQKIHTKYFIIFINNNNPKRFGFVASKKTGNAVYRNRIKRLTREVVRLNEDKFKDKSYVFVAKSVLKEKLKEIKYKNFEYDILKVLKRWNIYYCL